METVLALESKQRGPSFLYPWYLAAGLYLHKQAKQPATDGSRAIAYNKFLLTGRQVAVLHKQRDTGETKRQCLRQQAWPLSLSLSLSLSLCLFLSLPLSLSLSPLSLCACVGSPTKGNLTLRRRRQKYSIWDYCRTRTVEITTETIFLSR